MSQKLRQIIGSNRGRLVYWCQGCDSPHQVKVVEGPGPTWSWDGNTDAPTFNPSVLVTLETPRKTFRCHTFVRGGMVQFLGDCTHEFAGQTLPIPDWPYADGEWCGVEPLP